MVLNDILVINMTGLVLYITGYVLSRTRFVLNMTEFYDNYDGSNGMAYIIVLTESCPCND